MSWVFYSLISAFFSATSAIVEKKVLIKENALLFSSYLSLLTFLLSFVIVLASGIDFFPLSSDNYFYFIIKSLINTLGFFCIMYGIKNLDISEALPLLALTPGFVALASFFSFSEALSSYEVLGLIFLLIGTSILELKKKFLQSTFYKRGHLAVFLALFFMTISTMLDRYIVHYQSVDPKTFMFFHQGFMFLLFFLALLIKCFLKKEKVSFKLTYSLNLKWIVLLAFMTILYRYTNLLAVSATSAALALAMKRISVFFASIIGGKIFKEGPLLKRGLSCIFILVGSILLSL